MAKYKYEAVLERYCPHCGSSRMTKLIESVPSGKLRFRCQDCRRRTNSPLYNRPQILPKTKISKLRGSKFFVITSALNDTKIVTDAHLTFKNIADHNGGEYLVIPTVYRNPDLYHEAIQETYSWPKEVLPYICNVNFPLNKNLGIKAETRLAHTRLNPLSGKANNGTNRSEIYAHAQVAMELVATPKSEMPKMLHTTGTISIPNYGGSDTAQRAKEHHAIAALVVEIEGDKFWTWPVFFDGKGAYFLDSYYTRDSVKKNLKGVAEGGIYGDIHARTLKPETVQILDDIDAVFQPAKRVYHDVHDNGAGSHHNADNVIHRLRQLYRNELLVRDELDKAVKFLEGRDNAYIVDSNHDRHLDKWLNRFKPLNDPYNVPIYYELMGLMSQAALEGRDVGAFQLYVEKYCKTKVHFVSPNKPFFIMDIDCSQHGDRGPNGSRGSARAFSRSGYKTFIAHSHSPRIEKGCWQVGVSDLDHEYAQGYSNWFVTHGIVFDNGTRTMVHVVNGKLSPSMRRRVAEIKKTKRRPATRSKTKS